MKVYMVGGAVRDQLLGLPVHDRDWVAVGATVQQMLDAGYTPVGKDFPVFLHPKTNEEVALARTERKTGQGYHGFAVHADATVTLEEDLARRDLTINAIAQDEDGTLIDPYSGQQDLKDKRLRHVTEAFAEDPVRILRVARFAARYQGFTVAPETMQLMQQMVQAGEVDALVAERVWQELSKGLLEKVSSRLFEVLYECGALQKLLPEVVPLLEPVNANSPLLKIIDHAAQQSNAELRVSTALLLFLLKDEEIINKICDRLRVQTECKELALLASRELLNIAQAKQLTADEAFGFIQKCDGIRQPERFKALLQTVTLYAGKADVPHSVVQLDQALAVALATNTALVAQQAMAAGKKGREVGEAVDAARVQEITKLWAVR